MRVVSSEAFFEADSTHRVARVGVGRSWCAWAGCGVLLLVAFGYLMLAERGTSFYFDDWSWIDGRNSGLTSVFASYNQHLVVLPVALYQLLFRTVGLTDYWVFRTMQTLVHLSCVAFVFEFVRRRVGAFAMLVAVPFAFLGSGWEYVTLPVNVGFVATISLSVGALLALERDDRRGDNLACTLLVVALACSDFTVAFAIGVAVETMWRDGVLRPRQGVSRARALRRRGFVWATPLALYAVWWLAFYKPSAAHSASLSAAVPFATRLAAAAAGSVFGLGLHWGALLLGVAGGAVAWRSARGHVVTARLAGLLVTAFCFWLLVGYGRGRAGAPEASRYVYTGVVLLTLILAEAFRDIAPSRAAFVIASLVALLALAQGFGSLRASINSLHDADRRIAAELGALQIVRGFAASSMRLDDTYGRPILVGAYFAAVDAIGSSPADSPAMILAEPRDARAAADQLLLRAGDLIVAPAASSAAITARRRCAAPPGVRRDRRALVVLLPPNGISIWAGRGEDTVVRARRFARAFPALPLVAVPSDRPISLRAATDGSRIPWELQISSGRWGRICVAS